MPMRSSGRPRRRFSALNAASALCIAHAQRTARSASSGRPNGAPKSTKIASPMNSLMMPPCWMITGVIRAR